jgi:DNA polymerase III subunit delta
MPQITLATLRKQIASESTGPLYMLVGDDDSEKSLVATEFTEMVDEGLRAFNVERLFGADTDADELIHAAATLPMMAPRRVVLILDAEKLLIPKRESKAADEEQERLERFIENPPAHSTIVFVCGPLDLRRRVVKLLMKDAQIVDCGTIGDPAEAERWVKARAARLGAPLDAAAARMLVQRAGLDIVRLRAGLERLMLYAMGEPTITADDVRQAVSAAPDAQTEFGIAKAISRNDPADALHELHLALDAGWMPVVVLGQLRVAAERQPAGRLRDSIDAVLRTDLALKSSGGDARTLLERLVVEMCEPPTSRITRRSS